jgi:NADPH-dependent stearoyl-CoA 9-desaturase
MAIAEVAEYAHLSDADIEALAGEFEAIRLDIEDSRGAKDRATSSAPSLFNAGIDTTPG